MSNPLKIAALSIGYNNKSIVNTIEISTKNTQLIGVIGRNGKGKSTLLKTLAGLLPPIAGQFVFNDTDIFSLSEKEKAKLISIVSTTKTAIGGIKVSDFVAFGRYPYTNWLGINKKEDEIVIADAIQLCNIHHLSDRYYDELSDGEKQKVNIARAIAQNTPLIILDEPTVHLDLINTVEVLKLLKQLTENHGKTIVFSTHQIEYALQICGEIWLINNDKIEAFSPTELINKEKLKELFHDDSISFDKVTGTFKIR